MMAGAGIAALVLSVLAVAVVFSMLGQGGGVLYTPIQVWFGIDFHVAATTSLFLIMVTSLSATAVFRKAKKVDWPLALALESVTAAGGFMGGLFSGRFTGQFLSLLFAGVVAFAALFMVREFNINVQCPPTKEGFPYWPRHFSGQAYCVNMLVALPVSLAAGAASGLVGVGGGILKVPLMVLLLGIPMDIAVGSSAFMVGVPAAGGFAGHFVGGHWDWRTSLVLGFAVLAGAQVGARLSLGIDKEKMKKGFGWFLLAVAVLMCYRAL